MRSIIAFLLGLAVGLLLLGWQRSRLHSRLKRMLREVHPLPAASQDGPSTQLALVLTQQQRQLQTLERTCTELQQQLDHCQQVVEAAPFGYLQLDDENRLVWCNAKARSLLSIPQLPPPHVRLLLELVRSYELDQLADQTRKANRPCQKDWIYYPVSQDPMQLSRQDGQMLRGYGFPMEKQGIGIFLESRAETELLKQQRDRWASDVAHELKTPLTSIRLVAETLQNRVDPGMRGWVTRLVNETIRLSTLVQDLLDLAQLDRSLPNDLSQQPINLTELLKSAWLNLEPLAQKKNLSFNFDGPDSLILNVDEPRLYRVLVNLLDNAIKYSPPWSEVQARIHTEDSPDQGTPGWVVIDIIDAGSGFEEQDLPFVFDRFYKADRSRTQTHPPLPQPETSSPQARSSTGLGLAIVRQIIEAHQGFVRARNHPKTGGAWLTVKLPQTLS